MGIAQNDSLLNDSIQLNTVTISATRWSQELKNIPNKITCIVAKDIAILNPQTAADLLGTSGEIFIQKSQQGGGSPMIRGFATNRLLYSFDGVRMNNAIFRGGNIQNVISLDPFVMEKTDVFFGPGSIVYGSDAIGGVMSFSTLTPVLSKSKKIEITGKAVSRYSYANNEKTGHFDFGLGGKKWASITSFTYSDYGDLKMGSIGPSEYLKHFYVEQINNLDVVVENPNPKIQTPTEYAQINLMQKIRFSPNKNWDFQYGFHFSETSEYSRYDRLIETNENGLPIYAVWNYGPQKWNMNYLSIEHKTKTKLYDKMSIRSAQQNFEESRIDRKFNQTRLRSQAEKVNAISLNVDFFKTIKKHKLFYGIEGINNIVHSKGSAINIDTDESILVSSRYPNSTWSSYAAYLNYQFNLSEKVLFQAGVRYSYFQINSDFTKNLDFFPFDFNNLKFQNDALTESVGAIFRPTKTSSISFNGSTGFRAPNVDDIGKMFDFQAGDVIVPNPNLKAEYAYNAEITINKSFTKFLKLDANLFYTYLDNAMSRREFTINGLDSILFDGELSKVYAIQNASSATIYGFNAGFELKLPKGFSLYSRFNYQKGKEELDNGTISPSRHAAPFFGMSKLRYQSKKIEIQLYANLCSEVSYKNLNLEEQEKTFIYAKDKNGNPYSPAWFIFNIKAMYQLNGSLSLNAGIENISDQRYRPYSSGLLAAGRNFVFSVSAKF